MATVAFGLVVMFWLTFWLVSRWLGGRAAINLLGLTSLLTGIVLILGTLGYGVVWLIG